MTKIAIDDPLVTTEWLAEHIGNSNVVVVDASYRMPAMRPPTAREEYDDKHIPGAAFFDVDAVADPASKLPHMIPSEQDFARHMESLGIGDDNSVVVYDAGNYMGAPRAWWMLRLFGHKSVKVLDGGLKKWIAEGRATDAAKVTPRKAKFNAVLNLNGVRKIDQMIDNTASRDEQVVDARAADRFEGTVAEPWPGRRSGHIPGSLNVPFNQLIDADATMKTPESLREIFEKADVDLQKPIVTSCGSGVTAGTVSLALARLGVESALYDGSWAEWGLPDGPQIAKGKA